MDIFTDPRDNNSYKVVKIGNLLWFAENLRYAGVEHYSANNDSKNDEKFGYLYTFENARKACPEGWRLPTIDDFEDLLRITGAGNDDSSSIRDSSWKHGSNTSGFSAMPTGYRSYFGTIFNSSTGVFFWSSQRGPRYVGTLDVYNSDVSLGYNENPTDALSVRCVRKIEDDRMETSNYIKKLEASLYEKHEEDHEPRCYNCMHYNDNHEDYDCLRNPNHIGICDDYNPDDEDDECATPYERLTQLLHDLVDRLHSNPQDIECKEALEYFLTYQIKESEKEKA